MGAEIGNKYAEGNEGGRPSPYKEEYANQAYKLCLLGFTHQDLADFFDVNKDTVTEWMKVHNEFSVSVRDGKSKADAEIANSLYERAKGCTIKVQEAIKITSKIPDANGKMVHTEDIQIVDLIQEVPPDTQAAKFWLMNRQSSKWRDKTESVNTNLNYNSTELTPDEIKKIDATLENEV